MVEEKPERHTAGRKTALMLLIEQIFAQPVERVYQEYLLDDLTINEMVERLRARGVPIGFGGVHNHLQLLGGRRALLRGPSAHIDETAPVIS